ncbi:MAG: hypothetical protein LUG18_00360 [Candidatus Azobacteroides sp.]|nr:hypothetical protein [Candidatus Azobacteroides sp.]
MKNHFLLKTLACCLLPIFIFTSCLEEGSNIHSGAMYAEVISVSGQTMLRDPVGNLYYSENLKNRDLSSGDLLWANYSINLDEQIYTEWFTIEIMGYTVITDQEYVYEMPEELSMESVCPLYALKPHTYGIKNKFLLFPSYTTDMIEKKYTVELYYEENDTTKDLFDVYYVLREDEEEGNPLNIIAADMSELIYREGEVKGRDKINVLVHYPRQTNNSEKITFTSTAYTFTVWKSSTEE